MNIFGTQHRTRVQYCGLFQLEICDNLKKVSVIGPRRSKAGADRVGKGTIDKNLDWAVSKAKEYEMLGYQVQGCQYYLEV